MNIFFLKSVNLIFQNGTVSLHVSAMAKSFIRAKNALTKQLVNMKMLKVTPVQINRRAGS